MAYPQTPKDAGGIPVGCVYIPGVGFASLQGSTTSNTDGSNNTSAPANFNLTQVGSTAFALGQGTKANSISVTIASDQGALSSNASVGTDGSAIPTSSTLIGASDGTNLQQLLVESASNRNLRVGIYNGANEVAVDAGGRLTSIIQVTGGTALTADQTNSILKVSNYGKNSTAGDTAVAVDSSGRTKMLIDSVTASLSQTNRVPTSNAAQQGLLTITGSLSANSDNSLTFSGNATVARKIRIQNESGGTIYWSTDGTGSAGSPSLAAPASNAVSVEWIEVACTTLHIFIPSGGTTTLNGSGGVKVSAWA